MKTKTLTGTLAIITLCLVISFGCTKTIINEIYNCDCPDSCLVDPPPPACTATSAWTGGYASLTETTHVGDSTFINNGIARPGSSPYDYYFTSIDLDIPACRNLNGDSIRLDARVKNPVAEGAIEQLDVTLIIVGEKDSAWVNYIGRSSRQEFTYLGFWGDGPSLNNVPELVQLFQDWTEVSLVVANGAISTYKNGTLIKSYTIPAGKEVGRVKQIKVGFKGTGSVDWVKVYNSNVLKLREEFNTNKKSSVEWF